MTKKKKTYHIVWEGEGYRREMVFRSWDELKEYYKHLEEHKIKVVDAFSKERKNEND